ncbi:MAG: 3-oxoacyl-[Butyrivibrio sp.]|uniref:3-oxoacyl-[acyl-carrier-protein] reductase n=1 Tax=Butyrivibrio sp. TaxID=28121 RepID=UPI0025B8A2F6|nr:3-oxoacyl-[acyl-carrier-protein] reductase [Butyrivibrio sp.]MBQ6588057.1 3-oxoacyl-[acyl-carrier-protein] reductase [Butyrivibrio sp.]
MLNGKTAVVTGGSRGIGRAISFKLAGSGANIAVVATRETKEAKETIEKLKELGVDAKLYICDIKNTDEVASACEEILADFGQVDVLVNNAGITRDNILPSLSTMDIDDVIDVNLKGTMYVTKAFIRQFVRKRSGSIINISSVVGLMGNKGQTNYSASKAGIIGFTKSVAREYGKKNIRCNAVAPGYIATDMTGALSDEQRDMIRTQIPLGTLGDPDNVADLVLFLASDASSYITGEVIKVDGGMYV